MASPRSPFLILLLLAVCLSLYCAVVQFSVAPLKGSERFLTPKLGRRPSAIVVPEVRPGYGLAWSKRHYPEEYDPSNTAAVQLSGEDDPVNERYMDVGSLAYSREFRTRFSYSGVSGTAPDVQVTYLKRAETFTGKIVARGLKPNFAYQLKLRGVFADREAFERIGHLGRWRLSGERTNFTDEEYERYENKELAESYLLFDFMVTDPNGNAEKEFYTDSSLHVLWNASYQRPTSSSDTITAMAVRTGGDPFVYASPKPNLTPQWVFAEVEGRARNRLPVGEAFLPSGRYHAEFALTEESFHGYADEGFWATVMRGPVTFEIVNRRRQPLHWKGKGRLVMPCRLDAARQTGLMPLFAVPAIVAAAAVAREPMLFFDETLCLPAGGRYFLAGDVMAWQRGRMEIAADCGGGFEGRRGRYCVPYNAPGQWQRFEIEITSRVAGRGARLLFDPAMQPGFLAISRVAVYRIAD